MAIAEAPPLAVQMYPVIDMSDDDFFAFCQLNRELRIERAATGEIIIMSPAGGETGSRNADLIATLYAWAKQDGRGVTFDSSTGFVLPNKAVRAPDAAWVRRERLAKLTPEEKQKFLPLCPDFVVELRAPADRLIDLQAKMVEYSENGASLGWLIDPQTRTVHVYRPGQAIETLVGATAVTADPELPGFVLDLASIWEPGF